LQGPEVKQKAQICTAYGKAVHWQYDRAGVIIPPMRHVICALVMNEPGVLARVAGMFSARGFNIDSLVVGRTEDPRYSRMTIVVNADDNTLEQVRRQLAKIVEVADVRDFKGTSYVERDLVLITVNCGAQRRNEVVSVVEMFRGRIVDLSPDTLMIEMTGTEEKLEAFTELLKPYGIAQLSRTGIIAAQRGMQLEKEAGKNVPPESKPRTRTLDAPAQAALPPS
jgi:acetolactate synthase I/III small subunit